MMISFFLNCLIHLYAIELHFKPYESVMLKHGSPAVKLYSGMVNHVVEPWFTLWLN